MCSWQIHTQPAAFQDTHLQENTNQSSPVFTVSDMTINFSWTHLKNNDHSIMYVIQCGYPDSYPVPRKGFFWFLAQLMAWIFPSVPLTPNPPGTRMPLKRGGGHSWWNYRSNVQVVLLRITVSQHSLSTAQFLPCLMVFHWFLLQSAWLQIRWVYILKRRDIQCKLWLAGVFYISEFLLFYMCAPLWIDN